MLCRIFSLRHLARSALPAVIVGVAAWWGWQGCFSGSAAMAGQASFPDLVVSSISNPSATAHAGSSFFVTDTTGNAGSANANASTTHYRLSADAMITASDTLVGIRTIGVLKKGSSSQGSVNVSIPANIALGTYYLGACADGGALVAETSETNNCRASTTTVNVLAPVNLTATPSVIPAGGTVTVTWSQLTSASVNDRVWLYPVGSQTSVDWKYLHCAWFQPPQTPVPSGSCQFQLSTSQTPGKYEFRLLSNGVWVATSNTIVVNPPEPVSKVGILGFSTFPARAGYPLTLQVQSQSVSGVPTNVSANTNVSVSLKTGTGFLGGTLTGTIPAGTSSLWLEGMTYTKAESGIVLTATVTSGPSLSPGDSPPLTVVPGDATNLAFVTQPTNTQAGAPIGGHPTIGIYDSFGNLVVSSAEISTEINTPAYGVLYGTKSKNAASGIAAFADLTINEVGTYTLKASTQWLQGITSNPFNITTPLGGLSGTIARMNGGSPIEGAVVEASQAGIVKGSTTSGSNGQYSISGLATGIYEIRASASGFLAQSKSGVTLGLSSTATANFNLNQEKVVYVYDSLSRLKAVIDVSTQTATYAYDAVGNLLGISRYNSSQASIIEFAPAKGAAGTLVTIFGTGFSETPGQNTVTFNGTPATVLSAAPTQIVVAVPSGATTGPIGIAAPSGSVSSAGSFIVIGPGSTGVPTVTGFTPTIGTVGTSVTVSGTNFDPTTSKNDLIFNVSRGAINTAGATSLSATVPSGTGSGPISVTTALGKGVSTADFFVPPSPLTAADIEFKGRLVSGNPLNVILTSSGKKGLLVFNGTAGQRVSLGVINSTYPFPCAWCSNVILTFYRPNGSLWTSTSWANSSTHYAEPPVLPASGTYTILFDAGTGTGHALLTLNHVSGEEKGVITPGQPVSVSVNTPGQNPWWIFSGTVGQRISLHITDANLPMACPWCGAATVTIYKPDGQIFVQNTWANATGIFIDVQTLPISGTYTLVLDPAGGATGRATIALYNIPPDDQGPIVPNGTPVLANITIPGQKIRRSFSAAANQRVSLEATNSTLGCGTGSMHILNANLTPVASLDFCNSQYQYIDVLTLPESGTYWALLDASGPSVGQASLRLYTVVDVTGTIPADGTPTPAHTTVPGQRVLLTFVGTANAVVTLEVEASNFSNDCGAIMSIIKPDNGVLTSQYVCSGTPATLPAILPVSGTYTVALDPAIYRYGQTTLRLYQWPSLTLAYDGKIRDRVGQGEFVLNADGAMDGTFTVTLGSGTGARTVNAIELRNSVNGVWNAQPQDGWWVLGAASTLDATLYNSTPLGAVNFAVADGASFKVFGSDYNNSHFSSGRTFIFMVKFTDGSRAAGTMTIP